ncbi:hypothetical protein Tco_1127973 [Tanacetum coccineum]
MAGLDFCSKHNMVAYLEKMDGNTEFHQIMDFLTCSSIYYALTVSPIVSTSFVEQFWTTAKSRTVNNTSYIDVIVAGKPVTISEASIRIIPDPEGFGGNHGGQSSNDASLLGNEDGLTLQSVKKLKKGVKPLIIHHKAWMKTRLARKTSLKKKGVHKEYVSKLGRKSVKSFKGEPYVHKDPAFDDLDDFMDVDDTLDYMESEDAQDKGRTSSVVLEEKESANKEQDGGTDSTKVSTDRQGKGTTDQDEGKSLTQTPTSTPTPTVFGDDETIAQVLIIMSQNKEKLKEKEKGVKIRNVKETERPRPTSTRSILTLRPLPKIDPKDKGKKRIEEEDESDTKSEGITEVEKKFKQLANDEEVAKKVQEEWEAKEEKKSLAEEEATKAALSNEYDFIQVRLNANKILAEKLQEEERDRCILLSREPNFFMTPLLPKEDFLLNKDLKLSEINLLQEISLGTK